MEEKTIETIKLSVSGFREQVYAIHASTNHFYEENLPYSFHLKAAETEGYRYLHLLKDIKIAEAQKVIMGIIAHDVIEDTRLSYGKLVKISDVTVAELSRAVTNYNRGRTREERMPDWLYVEIRELANADFVKLCDRIANVKFSIFSESRQTQMYRDENFDFINKVTSRHSQLKPMIKKLSDLLETF